MQRRYFLWLAVSGTAALTLPFLHCGNKNAALQKTLSQPEILSRICDVKTLKDIGNSYRKKIPAENNKNQLQNLLLKDTTVKEIQNNINRDFEAGRIIKINGWILSVTEARQCALFSLLKAVK